MLNHKMQVENTENTENIVAVATTAEKRGQAKSPEPFRYAGFSKNGNTHVPNELFDVLAPHLSEAELRVLLYIIRRTCGFHKEADAISLTQLISGITTRTGNTLDCGTGLSKPGVLRGLKGLIEKGVVTKFRQRVGKSHTNIYQLCFKAEPDSSQATTYSSNEYYAREQAAVSNLENSKPALPSNFGDETGKAELPQWESKVTSRSNLSSLKVVTPINPQKNNKQKNKRQKITSNNSVVVGALALHNQAQPEFELKKELEEFGLSAKTAHALLENYSANHIRQKIDLTRKLLKKSDGTIQNPAGFLRQAIEQDYQTKSEPNATSSASRSFPIAQALLAERQQAELIGPEPEPPLRRYRKHTSAASQPGLPFAPTAKASNFNLPSSSQAASKTALPHTTAKGSQPVLQERSTKITSEVSAVTRPSSKPALPTDSDLMGMWEAVKQDVYNRFNLSHLQPFLAGSTLSAQEGAALVLKFAGLGEKRSVRPSDLETINMALAQRLGCRYAVKVLPE